MWHESRHAGSLAEGSRLSGSPCTRGGYWSLSSTARTGTGSRGRRNSGSPRISASPGRRYSSLSVACSRSGRSSSTSPVDRDGRRGIGCATSNLPDSRAGWSLSTCPTHGAGWRWVTCPGDGHEVISTHVRRSAVAYRALPGARRSLRSLSIFSIIEGKDHGASRRLRRDGSPVGGGGGNRTETIATRNVALNARSRLRPLPRPLADDEELSGRRVDRLGRVIESPLRGGRCPAEPQRRVGVFA